MFRYTVEHMDGKKGFVFRSENDYLGLDDNDPEWMKICEDRGFDSKDVEIIRMEFQNENLQWEICFDPWCGITF